MGVPRGGSWGRGLRAALTLKRIAAPKAPSVTIARHDPESRTSILIKTTPLRTANR